MIVYQRSCETLDTASEASHLVKLYEKHGFEFVQEADWE